MNDWKCLERSVLEHIEGKADSLTTPCYVYSVDQVIQNYRDLKKQLDTPLVVSLKANHCPELLTRVGHEFQDGYEIASLGELRLRSGTKSDIYVNSPAYTPKLVDVAARYKAVFILDHPSQLSVIEAVKERRGFDCQLLLRINLSSFSGKSKPDDHFGMDEESLMEAISRIKQLELNVAGLHIFCGSNNFSKQASVCVEIVEHLHEKVEEWLGKQIGLINMGGGIPAGWRDMDIDFESYRNSLKPLAGKVKLIHESGRAIFGSAGYFVSKVLSVKKLQGVRYAVCDGGMAQNFMLAKTESVIKKHDSPEVLGASDKAVGQQYYFVGASCNRDDIIGELKSAQIEIVAGNNVLFKNCGAYNSTYTVSKFLALPECSEYVV